MSDKASLRIAIIGAGPAGLTLTRLLKMQGYTPTVFEKETSPLARPQGGSLDLHTNSGLRAVHMAGLDLPFQAIARPQDQGLRILDKMGTVLLEDYEQDGHRPEVDRIELRAMLLDSLAPGSIQWAKALSGVHPTGDGTHALAFEHGRSETFDLVVGADGAWSRVRPLLSSASPMYTGETYVELSIDDIDRRHPDVARLVGQGTMLAVTGEKGLVAQRNARGHIRVYAHLRASTEDLTALGIEEEHPDLARTRLLELFAGWHPDLLKVIEVCSDDCIAIRSLYMLPVGHRWDTVPGVTLIGDAAHLMPPTAGQGVNQAMLDAVELAEALGRSATFEDAIRAYEQPMFERAARWAAIAASGLGKIVGKDAPKSTLDYFRPFTRS
ncbi:MAG TPA: NAD(P)/FAD-dependent oxidoreductase [Ktedonobacteraceae bacterium]|nr:NAD(P)/FAD-dependent oxidoreductase [Ktedonobacteraceae bacterium]